MHRISPGYAHRRRVNGLGPLAVSCAAQFFPRAKKCKRLQDFRTGIEKLTVQFAQGVWIFDGDFRSKLPASFSCPHLLPTGAAVHPAYTLKLQQVATITKNGT